MLPASRPIPVPASATSRVLATGLWIVTGWSFKETTGGAAATLELYDGRDLNSTQIAEINLSAGESTRDLTAGNGIACQTGIYVARLTGTFKGSVWAVPAENHDGLVFARGLREVWAGFDRVVGEM